jgi:NitT/TauT family transport system permease protein
VILPAIFPYLLTGLVTASGGAWNASIVAGYSQFDGRVMPACGLGSRVSAVTDAGNLPVRLLSTIGRATPVVSVNRRVWRSLYRMAERRFHLEN